jgi:hypothetical protein
MHHPLFIKGFAMTSRAWCGGHVTIWEILMQQANQTKQNKQTNNTSE